MSANKDEGTVHPDTVLPSDPLDRRARLAAPVMHIKCPNKAAFIRNMASPPRHRSVPESVLMALYEPEDVPFSRRFRAESRSLQRPFAQLLYENNPHLPPEECDFRRLPVPAQPLYRVDAFEFPFRGVDWAAIKTKVLLDGVTNPINRYLAVAAHQGVVVEGFERRIRRGMQELQRSGKLLAALLAERFPVPVTLSDTDKPLMTYAGLLASQRGNPVVADVLSSPHRWWAMRFIRDTYWAYAPVNTAVPSVAMYSGEYDTRLPNGRPVQQRSGGRQSKEDLLAYLEGVALSDVTRTHRKPLTDANDMRIARAGLVTFRLVDDRALPERVGYCPFITPRGWKTLWAYGRMTEWLEALTTFQSG